MKEKVSIIPLPKHLSSVFEKVRDGCPFCICMLQALGTTGDGEDWLLLTKIFKDVDEESKPKLSHYKEHKNSGSQVKYQHHGKITISESGHVHLEASL